VAPLINEPEPPLAGQRIHWYDSVADDGTVVTTAANTDPTVGVPDIMIVVIMMTPPVGADVNAVVM